MAAEDEYDDADDDAGERDAGDAVRLFAGGDDASRMMRLFAGYDEAYGTYDSGRTSERRGGKLEIRASARTLRSLVTRGHWEAHLAGSTPLGIIPIMENDTCLWGAIDVDQYDLELAEFVDLVGRQNLPLTICRTKSGGAHLFLFLTEPAPAEVLQRALREMAVLIGYGNSEIFPKQTSVDLGRGHLGSWLNMPYFGGDATDRYGVKSGGLAMTTAEFLDRAEEMRQSSSSLTESRRRRPEKDAGFGDGPPCMQHLAAVGVHEGGRNTGMFAFATFAKRKYGARWQEMVEDWNRRYFHPPLPATEVLTIIRAHEKKDYHYKCREHPIAAHCNSSLCRTRRFGVGGEDDYPSIAGMSVIGVDPPLWLLEIGDHTLELTTEELQNYKLFHRICMDKLQICYKMMKSHDWLAAVAEAMRSAVRLDAPSEAGVAGRFSEMLEDFVTNRHRGHTPEDLLVGSPFEDETAGRHYFRMRDLEKFLEQSGFRYTRPQLINRIRGRGGDRHFFNIRGKGVNAWWIPTSAAQPTPQVQLPPSRQDPI